MPIRTNRGRAAVYRRLWGWPMRSPRHLAIVVFVVAVVVLAAGIIIPQLTGSNDKASGTAAGPSGSSTTAAPTTPGSGTDLPGTAGATSSLPTRITTLTDTPESAAPAPEALDVADSWARAWVNHPEGVTNEQWLDTLRPFTTEEQLTEMSTVEPGNIGATKVTGEPETVESFTSSVKVKLPTDDGTLLVTVIHTPDGWRVTYYEQVDR
ncbi:hypothetical protein [Actinophytocola oryzae]|uniref:Uncharacterized protein n=1 Tax=Actinophytocola oryzae TaxID=502181 RepID=A0A4R7URQ6_9PSEU|nr:hypothetical protein [Actinophytocola oryzae]TDV37559.1 hypothetical protein CLV71_12921 [Actinophytocola oryzae]